MNRTNFLHRIFGTQFSDLGGVVAILLLIAGLVIISQLPVASWITWGLVIAAIFFALIVYALIARLQLAVEARELRAARLAEVLQHRAERQQHLKERADHLRREDEQCQEELRSHKIYFFENLIRQQRLPTAWPTLADFGLTEVDLQNALAAQKTFETMSRFRGAMIANIVLVLIGVLILGALVWMHVRWPINAVVLFFFACFIGGIRELLIDSLKIPGSRFRKIYLDEAGVLDKQRECARVCSEFQRIAAEIEEQDRIRLDAENRRQANLERQERRAQEEFWRSLSGREFELELGKLYRNIGYRVEVTRAGADGGIDIKLWRDEEFIIVQYKQQQKQVGRQIAQQLYGAMHDIGADRCILACTGGFNGNVRRFARGKKFELLGLEKILDMAKRARE